MNYLHVLALFTTQALAAASFFSEQACYNVILSVMQQDEAGLALLPEDADRLDDCLDLLHRVQGNALYQVSAELHPALSGDQLLSLAENGARLDWYDIADNHYLYPIETRIMTSHIRKLAQCTRPIFIRALRASLRIAGNRLQLPLFTNPRVARVLDFNQAPN